MKDHLEARALATKIVRESDCVVKFGRTNGRICLHLRLPGNGSRTIYAPHEWDEHPWNKAYARTREREPDPEIIVSVKNKEAQ